MVTLLLRVREVVRSSILVRTMWLWTDSQWRKMRCQMIITMKWLWITGHEKESSLVEIYIRRWQNIMTYSDFHEDDSWVRESRLWHVSSEYGIRTMITKKNTSPIEKNFIEWFDSFGDHSGFRAFVIKSCRVLSVLSETMKKRISIKLYFCRVSIWNDWSERIPKWLILIKEIVELTYPPSTLSRDSSSEQNLMCRQNVLVKKWLETFLGKL